MFPGAPMNPDRTPDALPDTFALNEGEAIALQVNTAHALGLTDTHFRDALPDGTATPELVVIPAGTFEYGAAPAEAAPAQDRPRRAALIERRLENELDINLGFRVVREV